MFSKIVVSAAFWKQIQAFMEDFPTLGRPTTTSEPGSSIKQSSVTMCQKRTHRYILDLVNTFVQARVEHVVTRKFLALHTQTLCSHTHVSFSGRYFPSLALAALPLHWFHFEVLPHLWGVQPPLLNEAERPWISKIPKLNRAEYGSFYPDDVWRSWNLSSLTQVLSWALHISLPGARFGKKMPECYCHLRLHPLFQVESISSCRSFNLLAPNNRKSIQCWT